MKKILLLAALAAPVAGAFAQAAADGSVNVGYTLPAGAFYTDNDALLPPHVQLQWLNTTYIKGQGLLTDAEYTWTNGANVIGTDLDLTTAPAFSLPSLDGKAGKKPTLATNDKADGNYTFGGNIYYGAAPATATATPFKSYTGATAGTFKAFQTGSSEAVTGWASLYPDLQNISVAGFAQKLTYAGAPYVLNGLTVKGDNVKGEYMVEVFAAPAEGSALPTEPIISAYPVTGADAVKFGDKAPVIKGDVIIAITEIAEASFQPAVALAKVEEGVPTPANQGLYAILSATANDGNQVATLAEWTEPEGEVLPVALDLNLDVAYTYLIPVKQTGAETTLADKDKVTVVFNETVTSASYDCVTSAAAGEITFTTPEGDELPAWLSATATAGEGTGAKYVTITFSQSSVNGGTTPVVVNFPNGTYAGFTVTTDALGGIDAPESSAEVVAREYYDIAGRRLNEAPRSGFFIEKAIRADGTTQSVSHIR